MIEVLKKFNIITSKGELNKKAVHLVRSCEGLESEICMITDFMPPDTPLNVRLKLIKDGITSNPVCAHPDCNNLTQYKMAKSKFDEYCCPRCYRTDPGAYKKQQSVMMEKYGVSNAVHLPDYQDRRKASSLETYGVEHHMKVDFVTQKVLDTRRANDPDGSIASDKRKATNLLRYGTTSYAGSLIPQDVLDKINNKDWLIDTFVVRMSSFGKIAKQLHIGSGTLRARFEQLGIDRSIERLKILRERVGKYGDCSLEYTIKDKDWMLRIIDEGWTIHDIATICGCSYTSVYNWAIKHGLRAGIQTRSSISSYELELRNFISDSYTGPIIYNDRQTIYPKELDILLPDLNIAVEMHGISYHSEDMGNKDNRYHLDKHNACASNGVRLVQIWGNEWVNSKDIVKGRIRSLLGKSEKIFARKCEIVSLTNNESAIFFESNHIQGTAAASVSYGLKYGGELVAAISFGKPRFNSQYEYELIRYCNKVGTNVIGGASRLFTHFVRACDPQSIITYSNVRWNSGKLYRELGFSHIGRSKPGYYYFHTSNCNELFHRFHFQKHKLRDKLEAFDPTLSEFENMLNHGYDRIWDCGNDSFEWIK